METYTYDAHGNTTSYSLYDASGKPKDCDAGFQKITTSYTEDGTPIIKKYFAASGKLLASQTYNKSTNSWNNLQLAGGSSSTSSSSSSSSSSSPSSSSDWRAQVRAVNEECPYKAADGVYIQSITSSGNSVTMTIKMVNVSKYDIDEDTQENLRSYIPEIRNKVKKALNLPPNVSFIVVIVDKANRQI